MACSTSNLILTFLAGALGVVVFHQATVAALNGLGLMPPGFEPWSMAPVPPFDIPALASKAFWGGLWALLLMSVLSGKTGASFWMGWIILGAIALPLVAIFVVPLIKGTPIPSFTERFPLYALVNAMWGLGTAVFLRLFGSSCG